MEWLDILILCGGSILILVGIIGCFLPVLPGPPLSYLALLLIQIHDPAPFSIDFMLLWLVITIIVTLLDYIIPMFGAKKLGGSTYGIVGSGIGLLLGLVIFPPFGIILGPPLGAWIGEMIKGKTGSEAVKAALGSFLGFVAGTFIKLISSLFMTYYFVDGIIEIL